MNTQDYKPQRKPPLSQKEKQILKEFENTKKEATKLIEKFQFSRAAETLYHYLWHTFADKILEESKTVLQDEKKRRSRQHVLASIFSDLLKLLHPFVPFVTEALYQQLPMKDKKKTLMIEQWPV
jgi:valyl-tRNA synthetase